MALSYQFDILNSFSDSIAVIESNGQILFTNYTWKHFSNNNSGDIDKTSEGVNYFDVCNNTKGEDQSLAADAVNGILKVINGKLNVFELEYPCHSQHERRWFILRATPIEGLANLTLLSHINITKRKIAEELVEKRNYQLSQINSRLNSSMYKIVHDIQGPLNSVQGLVNLSKTEKGIQNTKRILALIETSVLKLKEFIQEMLKVAGSNLKNDSIEFKTIIGKFHESIKHSEILKVVEIKFDINQSTEFINDKPEVVSIISNLINNSLKYYDPKKAKPIVIVSVAVSQEGAKISVKDNGIGIKREFLSKVFELNFQAGDNIHGGAGIGLYLVKEAVKSLNGQIDIRSKIGEGTEVIIVLPNKSNFKN